MPGVKPVERGSQEATALIAFAPLSLAAEIPG